MVNFQRTEPSKVKFYNGTQMANFMSTIPFNVLERTALIYYIPKSILCVYIKYDPIQVMCYTSEQECLEFILRAIIKKIFSFIYQTYTFGVSINLTNSSFLFHIHTHYWVIILSCVSIFYCICSDVCFYAS